MINRTHVENVLRVNGADLGSADDIIKSVLLSARYSKDEVDAAIMVLKENPNTNEPRVDGLHKVFRTSQVLTPDEISRLLGIETRMDHLPDIMEKKNEISTVQTMLVWFLSIFMATGGIMLYMYLYKVGLFHPSVGLAFFNGS